MLQLCIQTGNNSGRRKQEEGAREVLTLQKSLEKNKLVDDDIFDDALGYVPSIADKSESEELKSLVLRFEYKNALSLLLKIIDPEETDN